LSTGLIALLDDVAGIAKLAASSADDVAMQAAKAGTKSAGLVIDDAAVTPRYVVGFAAARELPIIRRIAWGSIRNKLVFLLPAALFLSLLAPWSITPLLMLGGAYLCYEGAEKILQTVLPHQAHAHEKKIGAAPSDPKALEDKRVAGAIRTDFILSAEIMAITLSAVPEAGFWTQATVLAVVGVGMTIVVYGAVALIVKADDAGLALGGNTEQSLLGEISRRSGRALVAGMPVFLSLLAAVGTAAMVWVGGGIFVHGLEELGLHWPAETIHYAAERSAAAMPGASGAVAWLAGAVGSGIAGLLLGTLVIPLVQVVVAPAWQRLGTLRG